MAATGLETQIVTGLTGLLSFGVTTALGVLTPKAKQYVEHHANAKAAAVANEVINGLAAIAETVVQNFNQTVVNDAKANGLFTPKLAADIKNAAVDAVKKQAGQLVALAEKVLGDSNELISSLVEEAVAKYRAPAPQAPAAPAPTTGQAPAQAQAAPAHVAEPQNQMAPLSHAQ